MIYLLNNRLHKFRAFFFTIFKEVTFRERLTIKTSQIKVATPHNKRADKKTYIYWWGVGGAEICRFVDP